MSDPELGMKEKWWKKPQLGGVRKNLFNSDVSSGYEQITSYAECNFDACSE